jgi:hypothetical protein
MRHWTRFAFLGYKLFEFFSSLLDVHMSDERTITPSQRKSGLIGSRLLAISVWNDGETRHLAEVIGAATLLDKTKLTAELIPAIRHLASESIERIPQSE